VFSQSSAISYQLRLANVARKNIELQSQNSALREAILRREPKVGAWDNRCPFCHATTECGEIPHQPDCAIVIAKSQALSTSGQTSGDKNDELNAVKVTLEETNECAISEIQALESTLAAKDQEILRLRQNSQNALGWFDFDHLKAASAGEIRLSGDAVRDLGYVKELLEKNL